MRGSLTAGRRADGCWGSQRHLPAPHRAPARPVPPDIIHKFIRDKYSKRFPELESLVPNALDYIRTVKVSTEEGPPVTTPVESALLLDPPGLSWGVTQLWARDRMGTGNRDWGKPRPQDGNRPWSVQGEGGGECKEVIRSTWSPRLQV